MKKCFVISPIGQDGSEVRRRADQLFKYIIKPVCDECKFEAIRVDQINQTDSITQTIVDYLQSAELCIADMTDHNPNAFYEMGFRASLNKPLIYLKEKNESIPFDIANMRTFDYDLQDLDSVDALKSRLKQTISAFTFDSSKAKEAKTSEKNTAFSQVLSALYTIQDDIQDLRLDIKHKDTETIQAVIAASQKPVPTTAENLSASLLNTIIPSLIQNPDNMKNLLDIKEMLDNSEKK